MNTSYRITLYLLVACIINQSCSQSATENVIDAGGVPLNKNNQLDALLKQIISHYGAGLNGNGGSNVYDESSSSSIRRSGSLGYGGLTGDIHQRIANVQTEIKGLIGPARQSVAEEIAYNNRNNVLLALVNFLGATFGVLMNSVGPDGLTTFISLDESQQILILAQLMYGYGYVTTFAFEYEKTALECGLHDYEQVEYEYSFIDGTEDSTVLKYFTTEAANKYKNALYCITSRKGSNSEAKRLVALIDLQAQLQRERLDQ